MFDIRVTLNGEHHTINNTIEFSGGELHVNIKTFPHVVNGYLVKGWLQSSTDIMQFMMACSALKNKYPHARSALSIPYMPYARQDRVCSDGDAASFDVFTKMLATINADAIYTLDLHSDAGLGILKSNCTTSDIHVISQSTIFGANNMLSGLLENPNLMLVSPDKGAKQKTIDLANAFGIPLERVVTGLKQRDSETGQLSGFSYESKQSISGKELLIIDDICDGGGTFIGLATELLKGNPKSISLYVTHGIFSKGIKVFDNTISEIYTTDSFKRHLFNDVNSITKLHTIHI
jgi:ribose-phosphate pyrophosphokinase